MLYRLLSTVDYEDIPIQFERVDIMYQLSVGIDDDIKSGEASPYYRFTAKAGEVYLIKALDIRGD